MKPAIDRPVVELAEWRSTELEEFQLTPDDRRLANALKSGKTGQLQIEELRTGLRITASSWVGVVRFSTFEVRVIPKLAGHELRLVEMIELTTGLDALRRCPAARNIQSEGGSLFDLIAMMLAEEAERIVRAGLITDYVEQEDDLPVVRGRILADRQVLQRVICRFDERNQDVLENQIVAAALNLCVRRVEHPAVKRKVRQLNAMFHELCDPIGLDPVEGLRGVIYNRLNDHYRPAHQLASLVFKLFGIRDLLGQGQVSCFAFMLDMNTLFERFVRCALEWLLKKKLRLHVHYQYPDRSVIVHAATNRPYARVIPDFLLQLKGDKLVRVALDAKYKLYDDYRVASSDIYQAFVYAYAYGGGETSIPNSALIYPSEDERGRFEQLRVRSAERLSEGLVSLVGLPIAGALDEMKAGLPGKAFGPLVSLIRSVLPSPFHDSGL
jgi:5-methylcytosine-specific restriction enzyme subunit McrC